MDLGKREGAGELGGVDEGETVADMYWMREESIKITTSQHRALTEKSIGYLRMALPGLSPTDLCVFH